ncbi:MAG: hypothetical protein ACRC7N_01550 [Clostridium sp.]
MLSGIILGGVLISPIASSALTLRSNLHAVSYVNISSSYASASMDTRSSSSNVTAESCIYVNNVLYKYNSSAQGTSSVSGSIGPGYVKARNGAYYNNEWIYSYKSETIK